MNAPGTDQVVAATGPALHGLARLGTMVLAVPIEGIREVVPYPEKLAAMPQTMAELIGAIDLRGAVVPVIDLWQMFHAGDDVPPIDRSTGNPAVIMVLRTRSGVVGVGVDEICGVVNLGREQQTAIRQTRGDLAASQGVIQAGFVMDGRSGVILDVDALAALPGLMLSEDRLVADNVQLAAGAPTLTFSVGAHRFGLAADVIEAAVPATAAHPAALTDPLWIASIDYNGRRIPVADTLHLFGLGACAPVHTMSCVVVRVGDSGLVALRIDAVLNMIRIRDDSLQPLDAFAVDDGGLIAGLVLGSPPIFLLDAVALSGSTVLDNLAKVEERADAEAALASERKNPGQAASAAARQPFLVFTLGEGQHAVPLDHVAEILPITQQPMVSLDSGAQAAVIAHRGKTLPVIDLAGRLGIGPSGPAQFILVANCGSRNAGFLLDDLRAVERLVPHAVASRREHGGADNLPAQVIMTAEGKTCTVIDLSTIL